MDGGGCAGSGEETVGCVTEHGFQSRRQIHVEPGAREKALLASDPALARFKSYRKGAASIRRIGDYLTIAVVAGCCYEIYVRAVTREEARKAIKSE
ncbi:hypothetical protein CTI12_AA060320 [Artemisia annua]|uniref:Uncharacterized protein n=1 Tax=Artemisia annua TaxID=35608 RepID=A0A2U1Q890_ARTAN|nr:hypothetical protein CTI12_AA060320 [Artemisia annua]